MWRREWILLRYLFLILASFSFSFHQYLLLMPDKKRISIFLAAFVFAKVIFRSAEFLYLFYKLKELSYFFENVRITNTLL
jgi:hypothetical protein